MPVLASVAAILLPMWPDLPIPVTMTRPRQSRHRRQARTKRVVQSRDQRLQRAGLGGERLRVPGRALRRPTAWCGRHGGQVRAHGLMMTGVAANICAPFPPAVTTMTPNDIAALIRAGLPKPTCALQVDDDTHFEAVIVASEFDGQAQPGPAPAGVRNLGAAHGRARSTPCRSKPTHLKSGPRAAPESEGGEAGGQAADQRRNCAGGRGPHLRREERHAAHPRGRAARGRPGDDRQRAASAGRDHDHRAARPHGRERHHRRAMQVEVDSTQHPRVLRALRAGEDDARVDPGARAAGGALRSGRRLAARRLRDRRAPGEYPRRRPAGHGRGHSHRERLHPRPVGASEGCATGARDGHGHRHREPDDGCDARGRRAR